MAKYGRLEALEKNVRAELLKTTGAVQRETLKGVEGLYSQSYYRTAFAIEKTAQAKLSYGLLSPNVVRRAVDNPLIHLSQRGVRDTVLMKVNRSITQGLIQGKSWFDTAREIKKNMNKSAYNAIRIARTEGHRAQNGGRLDSGSYAASKGVKMLKRWDATLDQVTRDAHQDLDGTKVKPDEDFTSGNGGRGPAPGQMGEASDDINCRCQLSWEIEDFEPTVRGAKEEGVIPYKTYNEYAKEKGWPKSTSEPTLNYRERIDTSRVNITESVDMASKVFNELDADSKAELYNYTVNSGNTNTLLRTIDLGIVPEQSAVKMHIQAIDKAFNNKAAILSKDITVMRGANPQAFGLSLDSLGDKAAVDKLIGKTFIDKAFVSASTDDMVASKFGTIRMNILAPKGAKAIPIDGKSSYQFEYEVLLPRSSKFKILDARQTKSMMQGREIYTLDVDALLVP